MDTDNSQYLWHLMARKLSGEATADELLELNDLLQQNPYVTYSKEILHDLWQNNPTPDSLYAESKYKVLVEKIKILGIDDGKFRDAKHPNNDEQEQDSRLRPGLQKKWYVLGASLLVLATFAFFHFSRQSSHSPTQSHFVAGDIEIRTKKGGKKNVVLPDGTKVWLNVNSVLNYSSDYGKHVRDVKLTGEGYFDVVKNADKPFIIHTANMDIKVLGTAFNVKCYPGERTTETSLIHGSIEVTLKDRQEKMMLKPSEKLVVKEESATDKQGTSIARVQVQKLNLSLSHLSIYPKDSSVVETAWLQNRLVFSSETFEEIALKMERWYSVKIIFEDEKIKKIKMTGSLEKETLSEALNALQLVNLPKNSFSYTIHNNVIYLSNFSQMKK